MTSGDRTRNKAAKKALGTAMMTAAAFGATFAGWSFLAGQDLGGAVSPPANSSQARSVSAPVEFRGSPDGIAPMPISPAPAAGSVRRSVLPVPRTRSS